MTAALALLAALAGHPSRTTAAVRLAVFGLGFGMVGRSRSSSPARSRSVRGWTGWRTPPPPATPSALPAGRCPRRAR
jgi:hypothetical protein